MKTEGPAAVPTGGASGPDEPRTASAASPPRLGKPGEFARVACHIVTNTHLGAEVNRPDHALRMAPRMELSAPSVTTGDKP